MRTKVEIIHFVKVKIIHFVKVKIIHIAKVEIIHIAKVEIIHIAKVEKQQKSSKKLNGDRAYMAPRFLKYMCCTIKFVSLDTQNNDRLLFNYLFFF